jgi:hypothetical protein
MLSTRSLLERRARTMRGADVEQAGLFSYRWRAERQRSEAAFIVP